MKNTSVVINPNPNGDTRTAPKDVTFEQFQEANDMHRLDVKHIMWRLSEIIMEIGDAHDITKKTREREQYQDFFNTVFNGMDFKTLPWYRMHTSAERHHLLDGHYPQDVNLLDVLEMISDNVAAGLARSGEVRVAEIEPWMLKLAYENTIKLIEGMCQLKDKEIK